MHCLYAVYCALDRCAQLGTMTEGTFFCSIEGQEATCSRSSGTATMPTFGSIVQKGKFAACALAFLQIALKSVDCKTQATQVGTGNATKTSMLLYASALSTALHA